MRLLTAMLVLALTPLALTPAQAQQSKNLYVIALIDVIPVPAGLGEVNKLLLQYVADSRKDMGVIRFDVVTQDGRPNHYTLLEVWQSREAFEKHSAAAHTRQFRESLQHSLGAPFDERLNMLLQ